MYNVYCIMEYITYYIIHLSQPCTCMKVVIKGDLVSPRAECTSSRKTVCWHDLRSHPITA